MRNKSKLIYLREAEADILDIVQYHKKAVGVKSARNVYQMIRREIVRLEDFPMLRQIHPDRELAAMGYRKLVLNQTYVAIYKINNDAITIYRVVNGVTDYPKLLRDADE